MKTYKHQEIPLDRLPDTLKPVLEYWQEAKDGRSAPSWTDFDLMRLPSHLIPTTSVTDVIDGGDDFRYRFWGSGFTTVLGYDLTGQLVSELTPNSLADVAMKHHREVAGAKRPVANVAEVEEDGLRSSFRIVLRLPLSDDGDTVSHNVTVVEYPQGAFASREMFEELTREEVGD